MNNYSVYVNNLPYRLTKEEFIEAFSQFGQVAGATIASRTDHSGRRFSKGYGFIDFATKEGYDNCLNSHKEIELGGRVLLYRENRPRQFQECTDTAFISGLNSEVDEDQFEKFVAPYHPIEFKLIKEYHDGRPGFGYAKFSSKQERDVAIEALNGTNLRGSEVLVRIADRPFHP